MFIVSDQFGGTWKVLGEAESLPGVERRPTRIDYSGESPLFIIHAWVSRKESKIVTFIADHNDLNGIVRQYRNSVNAGLDGISILLPPSFTNHKTYTIESLLKVTLFTNRENNEIGIEFRTENNVYSDLGVVDLAQHDTHSLYESD